MASAGYVLAVRSARLGPAQWARLAVTAYHEFRADRIVAERSFGGAMVENVITTAGPTCRSRPSRRRAARQSGPSRSPRRPARSHLAGTLPVVARRLGVAAPGGGHRVRQRRPARPRRAQPEARGARVRCRGDDRCAARASYGLEPPRLSLTRS